MKNTTIRLLDSSIHLETTDTVNGSQIPIDIDTNGTSRTVAISVTGPNSENVHQNELLSDNNSTIRTHVSVSQVGTYSVRIKGLSTNTTAANTVEIVDDRNTTINNGVSDEIISGSRLDLRLNSTYEHSSVSLVSSNSTATTLNLTTNETGPTPVTINTYASPESPSNFVTTGTGISVESVSGDTGLLTPGTYDLTLRSEHGTEVANDTVTVTVKPRSTNNLTAYTTRAVDRGDFENATAVREAIADGTLTEATAATANDTVVYAVNATGLTGLAATANGSLERGADLDCLDGLEFGVQPTATDAGNGSDGNALGRTPNESAVHLDRNGLYLVVAGDSAFGTGTTPDPGETFEAAFRVDDDRLRRTAADDGHRVTTGLTYAADPSEGDAGVDSTADSTETTASVATAPSGQSGAATGSDTGSGSAGGSSDGGGSSGGASGVGGSITGESSGTSSAGSPSGAGGATGSDGATATDAGGRGGPDGSTGSDLGRATGPPGVDVPIAPGTSEIPPAAGPAELSGPSRLEPGPDGSAAANSRSENGRPSDGENGPSSGTENGDGGGAASAAPGGSGEFSESSVSGEPPSDEADASDLGYDDAPIRSTAYDLPGFGPVASLAAVAGASLLARRREGGT
ncbi:PGF-CTERM sorting domain-containing protein [Halorubrum salinarum]|uniref:PGF-CTERM sorting domain-containing protein n=2 Tax=Halorubrum salinarum TaxID=2739057 RepID=A0A7D3YH37_9EURY|nr:PGF-CTERM sorting domain-containing protein [Halorubrum salinarum]